MSKFTFSFALALLVGATSLSAATVQVFTDDFNDNSKDGTKWGTDFDFQDPGAVLTEVSQRLEYTSPSSRSEEHTSELQSH